MQPVRKSICNIGRAAIAVCLLFGASLASVAEPTANRAAIEGRSADYSRLNPGVPLWPSTCDCISIDFGFKDASGYRPVRFRFADAVNYYGQSSDATLNVSQSTLGAKGPLKDLVEEAAP